MPQLRHHDEVLERNPRRKALLHGPRQRHRNHAQPAEKDQFFDGSQLPQPDGIAGGIERCGLLEAMLTTNELSGSLRRKSFCC